MLCDSLAWRHRRRRRTNLVHPFEPLNLIRFFWEWHNIIRDVQPVSMQEDPGPSTEERVRRSVVRDGHIAHQGPIAIKGSKVHVWVVRKEPLQQLPTLSILSQLGRVRTGFSYPFSSGTILYSNKIERRLVAISAPVQLQRLLVKAGQLFGREKCRFLIN